MASTPLAPGLHRLGGTFPLDGRVSWVPTGASGHQPSNCYVLHDGAEALVVDTGLAIHEDLVIDGLRELLGPDAPLSMFFTRGEMDCVSNLAPIAEAFDIRQLYTGGATNPFDAFDELALVRLRSRRFQIDRKGPGGDSVARTPLIEAIAGRPLAIESPLLRLLPTFWGWDAATGAIFTSDTFTHGVLASPGDTPVIDETTDDPTTQADVTGHLVAKYEWLPLATTEPLREWLADKFATLQPEIIAPARGAVLRGRAVVRRHLALMLGALGGKTA